MTTELAQKELTDKLLGLRQASSTKAVLQGLKVQEKLDKVLLILLDTSGSMIGTMEGHKKIDVAWDIFQTQLMPNMVGWNYGIICFGDSAYWEIYPIDNNNNNNNNNNMYIIIDSISIIKSIIKSTMDFSAEFWINSRRN